MIITYMLLTPMMMHPWMEIYVTYVDDEHVDNHDQYDNTGDDHDNINDIDGHISVNNR